MNHRAPTRRRTTIGSTSVLVVLICLLLSIQQSHAMPGQPSGQGGPQPPRVLNSQAPARLRTEDAARVTLLADGRRGWASLCRLVSAAHQAGQRGAPHLRPDLPAAAWYLSIFCVRFFRAKRGKTAHQ